MGCSLLGTFRNLQDCSGSGLLCMAFTDCRERCFRYWHHQKILESLHIFLIRIIKCSMWFLRSIWHRLAEIVQVGGERLPRHCVDTQMGSSARGHTYIDAIPWIQQRSVILLCVCVCAHARIQICVHWAKIKCFGDHLPFWGSRRSHPAMSSFWGCLLSNVPLSNLMAAEPSLHACSWPQQSPPLLLRLLFYFQERTVEIPSHSPA